MAVEKQNGLDWFTSKLAAKKPVKLAPEGIAIGPDDVQGVIEDFGNTGKRLAAGLGLLEKQQQAMVESGLTPEAVIVLTHANCPVRSKAGTRISVETVQAVLEAFFSLPKFLGR